MRRLALGLALCAGPACHQAPTGEARAFEVPMVADAPPDDEVVATVDGRPIRASQVALQARASGAPRAQALQDLITAETLAGEAARRRLDHDPEVIEAARSAAVRRYLHEVFERQATADAIPMRTVRRTYNANVNMFDHSEYVDVWHILIPIGEHATPEVQQAARTLAEEIARRAKSTRTEAAFKALADQIKPPPGLPKLKLERIVTARDGWVLKSFSYPAHDQLKQPGDTSSVVQTSYGLHVMFLVRRIPPLHQSLDDAAPMIRANLLPEFQRSEFLHFAAEAARQHLVEEHPERLPKERL